MMEAVSGGWPERRKRRRGSLPPNAPWERVRWWVRALLPYALVILGIALIDAATPPTVFAGTLFVVPILAASRADDPRMVQVVFGMAMVALLASMVLARVAGHAVEFWLPNRIIEIVALPGSTFLALVLQRQRIEARKARNRADRSREVGEILSGLVAHDLRAPIATTLQALDYLDRDPDGSARTTTIGQLRHRLTRSLLVSDAILGAALAGLGRPPAGENGVDIRDLAGALGQSARAFEAEASARGKQIELDLGPLGTGMAVVNSVALCQALTIVLDNAVRYAVAGTITVHAVQHLDSIEVTVADPGPGLSAAVSSQGARVGLDLCRAMLRKAGGDLDVTRDGPDGTTFRIRLPDHVTG